MLDTTVLILRERREPVRAWFATQINADNVAVCDAVILEYLMGARSGEHYDQLASAFNGLHRIETTPIDWERARSVQRFFAFQTGGGQRAVQIPDLLIAATAERVGMPVAHYDEDYDRIAAFTGQETFWVAPRGTL